MAYVTLESSNGTKLTMLLGEASPVLSEGIVQWDSVARPKRESITRFAGKNPLKQDIAVVFNGHEHGVSQEGDISKLIKMSNQAHTITLSGVCLRRDLKWVINDITWDSASTMWKRAEPHSVRTRQLAVIHLQEYVDDVVIKTPASPSVKKPRKGDPPKKIKTPNGMTLKQIAQFEFGDPDKWMIIVNDNPILFGIRDPRYVVPSGTPLVIWQGRVPGFTVP